MARTAPPTFEIQGTITGRCSTGTTNIEEIDKPRPRRQAPAEVEPEAPVLRPRRTSIACHWLCPCGGTVPDVPKWCPHGVHRGPGASRCADVAICVTVCKQFCEAYHVFRDAIKARKIADALNSKKDEVV
jgi:hypothetical protein